MAPQARRFLPDQRIEHGFALLTALVFLVILTLLGIGVFSATTSEEKMARNFRDREIALHAAEAALNEAKILITASYNIAGTAPNPVPQALTSDSCTSNTSGFACEPTGITNYKSYDLFASGAKGASVGSGAVSSTLSPTVVGLYAQPRYLIVLETNGTPCGAGVKPPPYCFKILAQAKGRLNNTRVNLIEQFTN